MYYDTSASHRPRRTHLLFQPRLLITDLLDYRRAYAQLSNLDDHMLEDIGISRSNIRSAIRHGRPDRTIQHEELQ